MRYALILLALTGCASPKGLENVVACTAGRAEAHVLSRWFTFAIGAKLADDQGAAICKGAK